MTERDKEILRKNHVDIDTALMRFGENEELYMKYFRSFPNDKTFREFIDSFKVDKLWKSQNILITFMGIVGNLGFMTLYEDSRELLRKIKNGNAGDAVIAIEKFKNTYSEITYFIKNCGI